MKLKCDNCDAELTEDQLEVVSGLYKGRVLPGESMPSGQCPECGGLVFEPEQPPTLRQYDLDNGSVLSADVHAVAGELVTVIIDKRDAANLAASIRTKGLNKDDAEAMQKLAELIKAVL